MIELISRIISLSFASALKNMASVFIAAVLWVLTCWIPVINVGTTIALFYGMPIELSKGGVMNPLSIFDGKYRKYMGEFFSLIGLMMLSIIPAMFFMIIPGIIISIGWTFAILLLVDKEMNPADAMTSSTKYTYGHKLTIFLSKLIVNVLAIVVAMILSSIAGAIDVGVISFIIFVLIVGLIVSIGVCTDGVLYQMFVRERQSPDVD